MQVLYPCCCGLDVHKKSITACVLWAGGPGKGRKEKRRFETFTQDLLKLATPRTFNAVTVAQESSAERAKALAHTNSRDSSHRRATFGRVQENARESASDRHYETARSP